MKYTQEEMTARRKAAEAARGDKYEAFKEIVKESVGRPAKEKSNFSPDENKEIRKIIGQELERKVFKPIKQVETASISQGDKIYRKFTCDELIKIFGGWFTLRYLFSVQDEKQVSPLTGKPIETDYYVCSQDVSGLSKKDMPMRNEALHKQFGVDVFGFCIIAPSTAF